MNGLNKKLKKKIRKKLQQKIKKTNRCLHKIFMAILHSSCKIDNVAHPCNLTLFMMVYTATMFFANTRIETIKRNLHDL